LQSKHHQVAHDANLLHDVAGVERFFGCPANQSRLVKPLLELEDPGRVLIELRAIDVAQFAL
jgi:hypothetical protein